MTNETKPEPAADTQDVTAAQESNQSTPPEASPPPPLNKLPSHSTLAFSNYPPLWSKDKKVSPSPRPKPEQRQPSDNAGASISTLKAVLSTSSNEERMPNKAFREKDPSNKHQYLQQPNRDYTKPRLNVFGRDIGSMGKPPPLFGGGGFSFGGKKKK